VKLFTIGFTKTSAEHFFNRLKAAGVRTVLDTRLRSDSQLSGFAKRDDLAYFLRVIPSIGYRAEPSLAPTAEILDAYRKKGIDWPEYERRYVALLSERRVETTLDRAGFDQGCLLCSEETARRCHRRLAAEYLARHWGSVETIHL
jgi:uncharacterized protein (DUF488 family)